MAESLTLEEFKRIEELAWKYHSDPDEDGRDEYNLQEELMKHSRKVIATLSHALKAEQEPAPHTGIGCLDCGAPYGEDGWCDVVIPNDIWNNLAPGVTDEGGGTLCFRCMTKRIEAAGLKDVPVFIASGPYRDANEEWRLIGLDQGREQRDDAPVYLVGGVSKEPLRHRVWGFFHDEARAMEAARNNATDIYEAGRYPLAVVVKADPGMCNIPESLWWFSYAHDSRTYLPIEAPEWTKRYGWMGFPEVNAAAPTDPEIANLGMSLAELQGLADRATAALIAHIRAQGGKK